MAAATKGDAEAIGCSKIRFPQAAAKALGVSKADVKALARVEATVATAAAEAAAEHGCIAVHKARAAGCRSGAQDIATEAGAKAIAVEAWCERDAGANAVAVEAWCERDAGAKAVAVEAWCERATVTGTESRRRYAHGGGSEA